MKNELFELLEALSYLDHVKKSGNFDKKHSHLCENCKHIFCHSVRDTLDDEYAHHCPKCHAGPFTYKHQLESEYELNPTCEKVNF